MYCMIRMTSLYNEIYPISTNERDDNINPLLRRMNKITLRNYLHISDIGYNLFTG